MTDPTVLATAVDWAVEGIGREFPGLIHHSLAGPADVGTPRQLTPVFFGCFDWHSAVHAHWLLARVLASGQAPALEDRCRATLARSLVEPALARERAYLSAPGRESFERPYGLAWLLALHAELSAVDDVETARWARQLEPLAALARNRLCAWFRTLPTPIRSGEHSQSAFALSLTLDACRTTGHSIEHAELAGCARRLHRDDRDLPLWLEPSAQDFLSPSLASADLMRRVLPATAFEAWWRRACPDGVALEPATPVDRSDGKSVHLDGLNLSRAWMLEGIARALPAASVERPQLQRLADRHASAGVESLTRQDYAGAHWLGTFAAYLLTGAHLAADATPSD